MLCRAVGVVLAVLALARTAPAQTPTVSPHRPLFAGASADPTTGQTLDVTANVVEAYDSNVLGDVGAVSPLSSQQSGFYTMLSPQVDFRSRSDRLQVNITAGSSARYFNKSHQLFVTNHNVGAGFNVQLTRRTGLLFNQSVTYAPSFLAGLFASLVPPASGDVVPPAPNYAVDNAPMYVYATTVSITHGLTPRAALWFGADYRYTHIVGNNPGYQDLRSYDAGSRFSYSVDRDVKLRIGYTYKEAQYSAPQYSYSRLLRPTEHDLEVGIDYSRPLSPTRKATFAFSVGPRLEQGALIDNLTTPTYGMAADASMTYQMTRDWSAQGKYNRGVAFIDGLQAPVYTDAFTASVTGVLSRRTDLSLSAASSAGQLVQAGGSGPFTTYTGDARLRVAVSKTLATYIEYLYYYYNFQQGTPLPAGVPPGLTRNGLRVGLTLRIPVEHR
jgi:hypothetical protein